MNPQERNLAEADLKDYGTCIVATLDIPKKQEEMAIKMIEEAIKEAVSQTQQDTVKGCLEAHETARGQLCLKHADDDCDCDYCYHFHSAVKEINLKYPTKE